MRRVKTRVAAAAAEQEQGMQHGRDTDGGEVGRACLCATMYGVWGVRGLWKCENDRRVCFRRRYVCWVKIVEQRGQVAIITFTIISDDLYVY